jgi:rfaE bifunctional protein nucleotidyltransferase chain/domain
MKKVWVNGCFDILHIGHLELLKYAKTMGDILLVGVDSDAKVKKDKGKTRPFNKLSDRIKMLEFLRPVDKVYSFNTTLELQNLIKEISPDLMVVGSDWKGKTVIGEEYAKEIKFFNRFGSYSTTNTIERLKDGSF